MIALVLAALLAHAADAGAGQEGERFALVIASGPGPGGARRPAPAIASVDVVAGYPRTLAGRDVAELEPGYEALVVGICATRAEANAVLDRLRRDGFPDAYLKPTRAPLPFACPALRPAWDRAEELAEAAGAAKLARVQALVAAGADVNHVTASGSCALGDAAYAGARAVVKVLLAGGAKPDCRGGGAQDETPLMLAVRAKHGDTSDRIAALLIDRGADVNATTNGAEADPGTSPLTEALDECRPALVRLLLRRGARVVIAGARRRCGTPEFPAPVEVRALLAGAKLQLR